MDESFSEIGGRGTIPPGATINRGSPTFLVPLMPMDRMEAEAPGHFIALAPQRPRTDKTGRRL